MGVWREVPLEDGQSPLQRMIEVLQSFFFFFSKVRRLFFLFVQLDDDDERRRKKDKLCEVVHATDAFVGEHLEDGDWFAKARGEGDAGEVAAAANLRGYRRDGADDAELPKA